MESQSTNINPMDIFKNDILHTGNIIFLCYNRGVIRQYHTQYESYTTHVHDLVTLQRYQAKIKVKL